MCRRCRSASGSVSPMKTRILQSGWPTPVDHHLRPLITTSSPSTTAVAAMLVASEEATSGSVIVNAERIRPSSSGSSHSLALRRRCRTEQHLHVAGVGGVAVEDQWRDRRTAHQLGDGRVVDVGQPLAAVGAEPLGVLTRVLARQEEVPQALRRAPSALSSSSERERRQGSPPGSPLLVEVARGTSPRPARSPRPRSRPRGRSGPAARGEGEKSMLRPTSGPAARCRRPESGRRAPAVVPCPRSANDRRGAHDRTSVGTPAPAPPGARIVG